MAVPGWHSSQPETTRRATSTSKRCCAALATAGSGAGQGPGAALSGAHHGLLESAGDAAAQAWPQGGAAGQTLPQAGTRVCPCVHRAGRGAAGADRHAARDALGTGHQASAGTRPGDLRRSALRALGGHFGGAPVQPARARELSQSAPAMGQDPPTAVAIGIRKAPQPEGRPGFIRIDSVHQGDQDGLKGLYHINAWIASRNGNWWPPARDSPRATAAGDRSAAGGLSITHRGLTSRQRLRIHQSPSRTDAGEATRGVRPSRARVIATTTPWWRPRTARWCASTWATATSRSASPPSSTSYDETISTRI